MIGFPYIIRRVLCKKKKNYIVRHDGTKRCSASCDYLWLNAMYGLFNLIRFGARNLLLYTMAVASHRLL